VRTFVRETVKQRVPVELSFVESVAHDRGKLRFIVNESPVQADTVQERTLNRNENHSHAPA
jgi:hypothetical protein